MSDFEIGILFYCCITFFIFFILMLLSDWDIKGFAMFPKEISKINNLNIFGGTCSSVVFFIISPWLYFCRFVYWIFHVKRK